LKHNDAFEHLIFIIKERLAPVLFLKIAFANIYCLMVCFLLTRNLLLNEPWSGENKKLIRNCRYLNGDSVESLAHSYGEGDKTLYVNSLGAEYSMFDIGIGVSIKW
jgi:hypothetical protein